MPEAVTSVSPTTSISVCDLSNAALQLERTGTAYIPDLNFQHPQEMADALERVLGKNRLIAYEEDKISPRTRLSDFVYTSTDFSAVADIYLHNECCTKPDWPLYIAFYCKKAASKGGNTTVASTREVGKRLPTTIVDHFKEGGVFYTRNLGGHVGNSIEYSFGTTDRSEINEYCRRSGMMAEWSDDGRLRLSFRRAPLVRHPRTSEPLWFNNAVFWNPRSLDRIVRRGVLGMDPSTLAFNSYRGDEAAIPEDWMQAMIAAYDKSRIPFQWSEGGMLILDNMLYSHGREKFEGERVVWVAMAEPIQRSDVSL